MTATTSALSQKSPAQTSSILEYPSTDACIIIPHMIDDTNRILRLPQCCSCLKQIDMYNENDTYKLRLPHGKYSNSDLWKIHGIFVSNDTSIKSLKIKTSNKEGELWSIDYDKNMINISGIFIKKDHGLYIFNYEHLFGKNSHMGIKYLFGSIEKCDLMDIDITLTSHNDTKVYIIIDIVYLPVNYDSILFGLFNREKSIHKQALFNKLQKEIELKTKKNTIDEILHMSDNTDILYIVTNKFIIDLKLYIDEKIFLDYHDIEFLRIFLSERMVDRYVYKFDLSTTSGRDLITTSINHGYMDGTENPYKRIKGFDEVSDVINFSRSEKQTIQIHLQGDDKLSKVAVYSHKLNIIYR